MTKDNVAHALETLQRVLAEIEWATGADETGTSYRIDFGPPHVPLADVVVSIDPDAECFLFLANFSPLTRDERRYEVARYITRANWELLLGNFEMDYDNGEVRFRSSVDFTGGELADRTLRRAILTAMGVVEAHAEALSAVIEGRGDARTR
jgi:hypothetical protein